MGRGMIRLNNFQEYVGIAKASIREHCKSDMAGNNYICATIYVSLFDSNNNKLVHNLSYHTVWKSICRLLKVCSFSKCTYISISTSFLDIRGSSQAEAAMNPLQGAKRPKISKVLTTSSISRTQIY